MPGNEQDDIRRALVDLPRAFRKRRRSAQFDTYRSTPLDFVRQLAVYSANLATLSIRFGDPEVGFRLVDGATLVNHSRDSPHLIFLVEMTTALPWWAGIFGIPLESVMG
ncbi:hypothetical protein APASM_4340 [Actinosynnema pretiosum subsp. pretiosum]|nr:hypothetical protein APASM_4340 [Actinosynnema pretiosum subsp. pretiosum]